MYYLAKFCRICIQTGKKLVDIESTDYDSIKFSDKLKVCTAMVINRESLSTHICVSCIQKLRVSYEFQNMCKKSTSILQNYLTELLSVSDKITADKFVNSEIRVLIKPLPKAKRKRVGKGERCSLLKKLLSKLKKSNLGNSHINGLKNLCDRFPPVSKDKKNSGASKAATYVKVSVDNHHQAQGGLKSLINFTKDFDFGYDISNYKSSQNYELSPLDKLQQFSENFFYSDFEAYRNTIVNIVNQDSDESDDEYVFTEIQESFGDYQKIEEVFVTPDLTIKKELVVEEHGIEIKKEVESDENSNDCYGISKFVEACYDGNKVTNYEGSSNAEPSHLFLQYYYQPNSSNVPTLNESMDVRPLSSYTFHRNNNVTDPNSVYYLNKLENCASTHNQPNLVEKTKALHAFERKHKPFSPFSLKCRTRGNPFINPQLQKQFQTRNFKCSTCNRRFKSPGYLKSHRSKLKH